MTLTHQHGTRIIELRTEMDAAQADILELQRGQ